MTPKPAEWRAELPPTLESIDLFCAGFHAWRVISCANVEAFSVELILREALTNSVLHASENHTESESAGRLILCVLRAAPGRLLIAIRDRGHGFDWRSAWNHHADPLDTSGRGIEILRHYADFVRFNAAGNGVTMIKRF